MKRGVVVFAFALVVFSLFSFAIAVPSSSVLAAPASGACPIQSNTNVVIYGDTGNGGVGSLSKSWITQFFNWWKLQDSSINYVFLDRNDVKTDCNLANYPNVKIYLQPGGNAYYQQNALGSAGRQNILNYIDSGRGYVGICAGAFYAANDYYWQGTFYNWPNLLKRYPTVEGSITDIADYEGNPGYAATTTSADGRSFNMIYYGGPTVGWRSTPSLSVGQKKLNFDSIPNNLPASVANGKMLLMSVHAEAFENDGITGITTEQRIENYKWFANSINEVTGTNFFVPAYSGTQSYQCSDGIDNDADGFIDFPADVGCVSTTDNDEFNSVSVPGELMFDDFEDGSLSEWTLSAVSGANNWNSVTTNPYQGVRHAESKPQSTSEPASVMERAVSSVGFSSVSVEYRRRLIGLDVADEFKVKWFDGSNWQILEQTAGSSANDASYVLKSFVLPSSAGNNPNFRIRFECTAGAVSEFCRVDNVKVTAQ